MKRFIGDKCIHKKRGAMTNYKVESLAKTSAVEKPWWVCFNLANVEVFANLRFK